MRDGMRGALVAIDGALAVVRKNLTLLLGLFIALLVGYFMVVVDPLLLAVKGHVLSQSVGVEVIQWTPTEFLIYKVKVSAALALLTMSPLIAVFVKRGVDQNLEVEYDLDLSLGGKVLVLIVGIVLFAAGVAYAYFLMMPIMMKFLVAMTPSQYAITYKMSSFYNFVALLSIAFGVVFELPLVLNVLVRSGVVSYEGLASRRREAYVGIIVIGAMLTPPDIVSQSIMAAPLIVFYEVGLLSIRLTGAASPKKAPT